MLASLDEIPTLEKNSMLRSVWRYTGGEMTENREQGWSGRKSLSKSRGLAHPSSETLLLVYISCSMIFETPKKACRSQANDKLITVSRRS